MHTHSLLSQEKEVYTPDPNYWPYIFSPTFFIATFLNLLCTLVICPTLGRKFIPEQYSKIGKKQGLFHSLLGSTLNAIVLSILTSYILIKGELSHNLIWSKSPLGFTIIHIALGYFVGDFIFCLWDDYLRHDKAGLVHHITGIVGSFLVLYHQGLFMFFGILLFITEFSTPFVNVFWVLMILDRKGTREFYLTSIVMVTVFFSCRLAPIYWIWKKLIFTLMDPESEIVPLYYKVWTVVTFAAFNVLNVLWFWKMLKGGIKEILKWMKKSEKSS